MHVTGIFPPVGQAMSDGLFAWATVYRIIFSIIGCYVTARLAPNRPLSHALWLGYLGVVVSAVATVVTWNKGPAFGPHWYPIALVLVAIPCGVSAPSASGIPRGWPGSKVMTLTVRATA